MTVHPDPTIDYERHPGRVDFERIRESGNIDELMNFVEAFIRRGHNPENPNDEMYAIMGITPVYLDFMKHDFESRPKPAPVQKPNPSGFNTASQPHVAGKKQQHGGGKARTQRLGFGPEDDM